ncbi:ANR family transcriptional regulator [Arsenophonus sp. PmNCSU2021_1]|uniref:ANR family transcriptional regulator n=1 Tax=Arsenophonus sp. PmNCSU2021_1 TaxID=3118989 RepID=UPI002FF41051
MTEYKKLTETAKNLEKIGFFRRAVTQWRKAAFIADSEKKQEACIAAIKRCSGYPKRSF